MKTSNFPERKNERRKRALEQVRARIKKGPKADPLAQKELETLQERIVVDARGVRSKINRTGKGRFA